MRELNNSRGSTGAGYCFYTKQMHRLQPGQQLGLPWMVEQYLEVENFLPRVSEWKNVQDPKKNQSQRRNGTTWYWVLISPVIMERIQFDEEFSFGLKPPTAKDNDEVILLMAEIPNNHLECIESCR